VDPRRIAHADHGIDEPLTSGSQQVLDLGHLGVTGSENEQILFGHFMSSMSIGNALECRLVTAETGPPSFRALTNFKICHSAKFFPFQKFLNK